MLKATVVVVSEAETKQETIEAVSPLMMMARVEMMIDALPVGVTVNVEFEGRIVLCKAK